MGEDWWIYFFKRKKQRLGKSEFYHHSSHHLNMSVLLCLFTKHGCSSVRIGWWAGEQDEVQIIQPKSHSVPSVWLGLGIVLQNKDGNDRHSTWPQRPDNLVDRESEDSGFTVFLQVLESYRRFSRRDWFDHSHSSHRFRHLELKGTSEVMSTLPWPPELHFAMG